MAFDEQNWQNYTPTQSRMNNQPSSFTAAATIAPRNFLSFITGTTALATITPPLPGVHTLAIVAVTTNWAGCVTTGNIILASITNGTTWTSKVNLFVYNPINGKYYPNYAVTNTTDA